MGLEKNFCLAITARCDEKLVVIVDSRKRIRRMWLVSLLAKIAKSCSSLSDGGAKEAEFL
jgi:hypothetical protein